MNESRIWPQLLVGWSAVWVLFAAMLITMHRDVSHREAVLVALRLMLAAALLTLLVRRLTRRLPWPHPFRPRFIAVHAIAGILFAAAWVLLNSLFESLHRGRFVIVVGIGIGPFLVMGVWLYVLVAGVAYAAQATQRAARVEALAARAQLAALRAQLHPHFLFNALHTVVQLIPREPERAAQAAEQIAGLLRTTIEEDRDLIPLEEEWGFVERYVDIERIRFGDRLRLHVDLSEEARSSLLPSFALQTLVENALRHGVMPRVEPTDVTVVGRLDDGMLKLVVRDTGMGAVSDALQATNGTGLQRLRERLEALYGGRARLEVGSEPGGGFTASLTIPPRTDDEA